MSFSTLYFIYAPHRLKLSNPTYQVSYTKKNTLDNIFKKIKYMYDLKINKNFTKFIQVKYFGY